MRTERSKYYASEALLSFSSKVRRKATNIDSFDYQSLLDDDDSLPLHPGGKFLRKSPIISVRRKNGSCVDTAAKHNMIVGTDEESRVDEQKYLLASDDDQLEDRCQVIETSSLEESKPYHYDATEMRLLLPGLVDFGGSSRQGPMTMYELGFQPGKKTIHFSTVEVKSYQWDYNCDKDVFYSKHELSVINKQRYEEASKLQRDRLFSKQHKEDLTPTILSLIFDYNDDIYKRLSSRGIEHFVYPELRREIIRKQRLHRAEVVKYARSMPFDQDGSKLREHSEQYSRWARELAVRKAKSYAMNTALVVPKKKETLQMMSGERKSAVVKRIVKEDATILEFQKVKISRNDFEVALETSRHKCSDSKQESENTTSCTLVEI